MKNDKDKDEFMDFLEGKRVCVGKISETMYGYDYVPREPEEIWQWHKEKMEEAYEKGYADGKHQVREIELGTKLPHRTSLD